MRYYTKTDRKYDNINFNKPMINEILINAMKY